MRRRFFRKNSPARALSGHGAIQFDAALAATGAAAELDSSRSRARRELAQVVDPRRLDRRSLDLRLERLALFLVPDAIGRCPSCACTKADNGCGMDAHQRERHQAIGLGNGNRSARRPSSEIFGSSGPSVSAGWADWRHVDAVTGLGLEQVDHGRGARRRPGRLAASCARLVRGSRAPPPSGCV